MDAGDAGAASGGMTSVGGTGGGGTISGGGGAGGTGLLSAAQFGQKYRFADNQLPGWKQAPAADDPDAFDVYTGTDELVARIDGAADSYYGFRVAMFQDLVGPDPQTCNVVAMDFVTDAQATAKFAYQRENGASTAIPGYDRSVAIASTDLAGITVYAHFKALYFELQMSGYADQSYNVDLNKATTVAAQFLGVLKTRTSTGGQVSPPQDAQAPDTQGTVVLPPECVFGTSVACTCMSGQPGAQVCTSAGKFAPCVCAASTTDAGDAGAASGGGASATGGAGGGGGASATGGVAGGSGSSLWDEARIANTGTDWWLNIRKGAYFFSLQITPAYQDDTVGRADVISFGKAVAAKLTSASPAPATLVPAANEVSGWTFDPGSYKTATGPAVATNGTQAEALIDGAAAAFFDGTKSYQAKGLAWEDYINDTYQLVLQVWQMANTADATLLYADLLTSSVLYGNAPFIACSGTDPASPCGAH
jgi:hypothetical protein